MRKGRDMETTNHFIMLKGHVARTIAFLVILTTNMPFIYGQETYHGAVQGNFAVSPTGAATYTVPIDVPPGINGMQPQLTIAYNSQSGMGLAGWGCNLAGYSSIMRRPKDKFHDGVARGMRYGEDDAYYLDGKRLVLSSGTEGMPGCIYNPEGNPYTTVKVMGSYSNGFDNRSFEVRTPDGLVATYGTSFRSSQSFYYDYKQRIASWYLSSITDALGNKVSWYYSQDQHFIYPTQVSYGNCCIMFYYTSLGDAAQPFRLKNVAGKMDKLLTGITCKSGDTILRQYNLTYDTTSDGTAVKLPRLTEVTVSDGNGQELRPLNLGWNYMPSENVSRVIYSNIVKHDDSTFLDYEDNVFTSVDINCDGISDIVEIAPCVQRQTSERFTDIYAHLSRRDSQGNIFFDNDFHTGLDGMYLYGGPGISSTFSFDFYGNGLPILMVPYYHINMDGNVHAMKFQKFVYEKSTSMEESLMGNILTTIWLNEPSEDVPLFTTGDFDGSGKSSIVVIECEDDGYGNYYGHVVSDNSIWNDDGLLFPLSGKPQSLCTGDFDNDGMLDLMVILENGYRIFPNRVGDTPTISFFGGTHIDGTTVSKALTMRQGDFNGDGLVDFVINRQTDRSWNFAFNNGDGTFTQKKAATLDIYDQPTDYDNDKYGCTVLDFDHDGKSDVVFTKAMYGVGQFWPTNTLWLRSTGDSLIVARRSRSYEDFDARPQNFSVGDFNGDGYEDLMNYGYDCSGGYHDGSNPNLGVYLTVGMSPSSGKVTDITDGLGNLSSIGYGCLTTPGVYEHETTASYPLVDVMAPLSVVRTVLSPTAASQGFSSVMNDTYSYSHLLAHIAGRGLIGFMETTVSNDIMGTFGKKTVSTLDTLSWIPTEITDTVIVGGQTSSVRNVTELSRIGSNFTIHRIRTCSVDFDGNAAEEIKTFDLTSGMVATDWLKDGYAADMYTETDNDSIVCIAGRWLPRIITQYQKHKDDSVAFKSEKTVSYNNRGLPDTVTVNAGTSLPLTTVYRYDQWGNPISETVNGSGLETVTTHYEYDYSHRFLTKKYTTPSSTVTEYTHDAWGNDTTVTDRTDPSNPLTTKNSYDGFSNLTESISQEGIITNITRTWNDGQKRYCVHEETPGRPWVETWYDTKSRVTETRTNKIDFINTPLIKHAYYDARGNIIHKESELFITLEKEDLEYDDRGRIVKDSLSTGSVTNYSYDNRKVTSTTDGKTRTTWYDAWGNVKKVQEPYGSVTYTYNSNGKPATASTGNGIVSMNYDDCGNQVSLVDPDAGMMTYSYNAAGQIISQTDARGITTSHTLDSLNRVKRTTTGNTVVNFTYGTTGNASQRLTGVSTPTHGIYYTYDSFGRVSTETRNFGSTQYVFTNTYDSLGNLSRIVYPGNVTVDYLYEGSGNCEEMKVNGERVWYWADYNLAPNSNDLLMTEEYGEGLFPLVKTTRFDEFGNLSTIVMTRQNSTLHAMTFHHDSLTGNLLSRSGMLPNGSETFTYDDEDRLIRWQSEYNAWDEIYQYTHDGNINFRTGIGYYDYPSSSSPRPHAVRRVDNMNGKVPTCRANVAYNDMGKASFINEDATSSAMEYELVYGPDGERWETTLRFAGGSPQQQNRYVREMEILSGSQANCTFYYIGHGVILRKAGNTITPLYAFTDNLGSIVRLYTVNGTEKFKAYYKPWGEMSMLMNHVGMNRGYCGHEMLSSFQMINMNGRMYDPVLGRFLSPDNYVQLPTSAQSFNRYSYCLNNPLKYLDPDGEWFGIDDLLVAGVSFVIGYTSNCIKTGDWGWKSIGNGATTAFSAWLGYNTCGIPTGNGITSSTWNQLANIGINSISNTFLPTISIPINNNINIGFSLGFGYGDQGLSLGISHGITYSSGDFSIGSQLGMGNNYHGWRADISIGAFSLGYGITYYNATHYGDYDLGKQKVGSGFVGMGDVSFALSNDLFAENHVDRWRTSAAELKIGNFAIGSYVLTNWGEKESDSKLKDVKAPLLGRGPKKAWEKGNVYSAPFWIGLGKDSQIFRIGYSSRYVQTLTQNAVHKYITPTPFFTDYDKMHVGVFSYYGYNNPFTLWNY